MNKKALIYLEWFLNSSFIPPPSSLSFHHGTQTQLRQFGSSR